MALFSLTEEVDERRYVVVKKFIRRILGLESRDRVIIQMTDYISRLERENRRLKSQIVELANK